jgi:hypothetical protein
VDRLTGRADCIVVEGEFDAILVWQEVGDLVDVLTLGNASGRLTDRWLPCLLPIRRFWIATDSDPAGHQAAAYWLDVTGGRGRRILPPSGAKDVGDAWLAGADIRAWAKSSVDTGRCEAAQLSTASSRQCRAVRSPTDDLPLLTELCSDLPITLTELPAFRRQYPNLEMKLTWPQGANGLQLLVRPRSREMDRQQGDVE